MNDERADQLQIALLDMADDIDDKGDAGTASLLIASASLLEVLYNIVLELRRLNR